jgi:hypothetical protein
LKFEYLSENKVLIGTERRGPGRVFLNEKSRGRKSCDRVPFTFVFNSMISTILLFKATAIQEPKLSE